MCPATVSRSVQLPGGLLVDGRVERSATLRPVTGQVERVCDQVQALSRPERVTRQLAAAVASIGPVAVDQRVAGELAVGDRKFLMVRIAAQLSGDEIWLSPRCTECSQPYDVAVRRSQLPVVPAKNGYPFATVAVDGREVKVRAPSGRDQQQQVELGAEATEQTLLELAIVSVDGQPPSPGYVRSLGRMSIEALGQALEAMSPDLGTRMQAACPSCGHAQVLDLDPYDLGMPGHVQLDEAVHTIASHYHWSEAEILSLDREQRQRYLALIDRERGIHG